MFTMAQFTNSESVCTPLPKQFNHFNTTLAVYYSVSSDRYLPGLIFLEANLTVILVRHLI